MKTEKIINFFNNFIQLSEVLLYKNMHKFREVQRFACEPETKRGEKTKKSVKIL